MESDRTSRTLEAEVRSPNSGRRSGIWKEDWLYDDITLDTIAIDY